MAAVLPSWIKKYGQEEALKMYEEYKQRLKNSSSKKTLIEKYGESYVVELSKKKVSYSLESCIKRYGKEAGEKKWQEILDKKLKTQKENFKNKKWNNGRTLIEYQERYGVEDGYSRWKKRNDHQSYMVSSKRYTDDFGDLGKDIVRNIKNTNSLDKFVSREGKEVGEIKYNDFIAKCKQASKRSLEYWINHHSGNLELATTSHKNFQDHTSLEKFVSKYGEIVGTEKYLIWKELIINNPKNPRGYSKSSQELFWKLYRELSLSEEDTSFHELNKEQIFYKDNSIIKVDFKYKTKIIEFNGDYWHANPAFYKEDEKIKPGIVKDIWKKDSNRVKWLESCGYKVLIVWEREWKKDKDLVLNECKNFLKNESE